MNKVLLSAIMLTIGSISCQAQSYPYQDATLSFEQRAADLCSRLTLDEKISLMQNASPAIPRLGIPEFEWWSEALHGVARNGFATVFPITMGMAASFNDQLVYNVFNAVSDEARAKNNEARHLGKFKRYQSLSFWTPNINIFRDPRWGRGQETYGEDPYLTTRMGLAVVRGLQGPTDTKYAKLLACAKHYAVHSGPEWNRHEFNVEDVPPRDLWETYLPAFKSLVQDGHVAEVMCAYQRIDGEPCCGNPRYLTQILRNDWKFNGLVVSDCGAISDFWVPGRHGVSTNASEASAMAVRAGTDVECGSNYKHLKEAVATGLITEAELDVSVRRLLKARFELGDFDSEEMVEWKRIPSDVIASKEHHQLALQAAHESIVLLQNNNQVLPLSKSQRIVVIGPNANDSIMQWGNYSGYPTATTTILKGIQDKCGGTRYVQGCGLTRNLVENSRFGEIISANGARGLTATYYNNVHLQGEPCATMQMTSPINLCNGGNTVFAPNVPLERFSARYEGTFIPTHNEEIAFLARFDDGVRLIVNGDTLGAIWNGRERIQKIEKAMTVKQGEKYHIQIDYVQNNDMALLQFDIIHRSTPTDQELLAATADADVVVFVGGISPSLEGEEMKVDEVGFKGGDRTDIELPKAQRDVMALLHRAGRKIVYVNCSGCAIGLEAETKNADAIVQAWYPGESGGKAVADVLFGDYNPSGKLPVTFYRNVGQLPDFLDYSMAGRTYRYFQGDALFPFGFGLSYTTFTLSQPTYNNRTITVDVKNTGHRAGAETIQVYIKKINDKDGSIKTLRAFEKVTLQPGESKTLNLYLNEQDLEWWDASTNTMRFQPGEYDVWVGTSSQTSDLKKLSLKF